MRVKTILFLVALTFVMGLSTVCFAQKLDTSSQSAYNSSLAKIFDKLSPDRQLEFEAFLYCLTDGGKPLVKFEKLKGLKELEDYYPIVEAIEEDEDIKFNGMTADDVISQGKKLLSDNIKEKIASTKNEALVETLKAQLAIVEKKAMTKEDFEAYNKLRE